MKFLPLNNGSRVRTLSVWLGTFIIVLTGVEVLVRTTWFWTLHQPLSVEQRFIEPAFQRAPNPQVVFMGNSRLRLGLSPIIIGDILGLPATEVANIAFDGGKPHEFLQVYQEHRPQLQNAKFLVIGVEVTMFKKALVTKNETPPRFWQDASLSWVDKMDLLVGRFWKTWDTRSILSGYLKGAVKAKRGPYFDDLGRNMMWPQPNTHPSDSDSLSRRDHVNYLLDERELQALQELVALAREDGMEVMLVDAPLGPVYRSMVEERFSGEDAYWRHQVEEKTRLNVARLPFTNGRCVEWGHCFVDSGHLNPHFPYG